MKKSALPYGLALLLLHSCAPKYILNFEKDGFCGYYYKTEAAMRDIQGEKMAFYQLQPGETIASIGAQCCHWEAMMAAFTDSLQFYLEDIDSTSFNLRQTAFAWEYYGKLKGRPLNSRYRLILGTEKETRLPEGVFDKIIIINSFHEFDFPTEMLADILKKLKPGGSLFLDEIVAKKEGQIHAGCKKRLYTRPEMDAVITASGFIKGAEFNASIFRGKTREIIYRYQKP